MFTPIFGLETFFKDSDDSWGDTVRKICDRVGRFVIKKIFWETFEMYSVLRERKCFANIITLAYVGQSWSFGNDFEVICTVYGPVNSLKNGSCDL